MEFFFVIAGFVVGCAILVAPVLAFLAFRKGRRLAKELLGLEERLGSAEARLEEWGPRGEADASPPPTETAMAALPKSPIPKHAETVPKKKGRKEKRARKPKQARQPIRWEQWVGVRGAAVLGGLLFALAGLLLFKHAYERGWTTPRMRVISGLVSGTVAIVTAELFRRRSYRFAPSAAAGGGVVVLYSTVWASYRLYEFTSAAAALPLMALVTAVCAWLAVRFQSQLVATLGLVGGFATPLLLSIQADHPIGLFGYLLLLDLGLLSLGQRMKWPSLSILGMLGTFAVELVWIQGHLDSSFFSLALGSLGAFALIFAAAGLRSPAAERRRWFISQVGALLLPFAFAAYFAALTDFGQSLWPLATLVAFLGVGASWVGSRQEAKWLVTGAAAGALAVTATWLARTGVSQHNLWEFCASSLGLVVVFMTAEWVFGRSQTSTNSTRWDAPVAPAICSVGLAGLAVLAAAFHEHTSPWPWLVLALGHAALLHLQGYRHKAGFLRFLGALFAGLVLGAHLLHNAHSLLAGVPGPEITTGWMAFAVLFFSAMAWISQRHAGGARWAWRSAAVFPLVLLAMAPTSGSLTDAPIFGLGTALLLGLGAVLPAMVRGLGGWYALTLLVYALRRAFWVFQFIQDPEHAAVAGDLFILELGAVGLLAATPLLARQRLGANRLAWAAVGIFFCITLPSLDDLLGAHLDKVTTWQAYAALALVSLFVGVLSRAILGRASLTRDSATRWCLGAAVVLSCFGLAQYFDHQMFLVGVGLAGLGLALLWRALPTLGLKLTVLGCVALSALSLAAQVAQGFSGSPIFESSDQLAWNWTSYSSGLPLLSAFGAALLLAPRESDLLTNLEWKAPFKGRAWVTGCLGLAATLLAFVWLNLQVLVYFTPGEYLQLGRSQGSASDLTLSIVWILYALSLLAAGMARNISALRQISLGFLLITLLKVFLHDLGDLEGLFRVASLLGLGLSLLLVSVLYQRFVFPARSGADKSVEASIP